MHPSNPFPLPPVQPPACRPLSPFAAAAIATTHHDTVHDGAPLWARENPAGRPPANAMGTAAPYSLPARIILLAGGGAFAWLGVFALARLLLD